MRKLSSFCLIGLVTLASSAVLADTTWHGEFYNIMPKHAGVTVDYCKAHVLDTYDAPREMALKEVTAANGLKGKDMGFKVTEKGGVIMRDGSAMISGTLDDKPWSEKIYYFGQSLEKDGMEQGAWYTKDCKGFYKVGPA